MIQPLWQPSEAARRQTRTYAFMRAASECFGARLATFADLHAWSVAHPESFWQLVWDFAGVVASRDAETVVVDYNKMPGTRWFPAARLNFAENLLRRRDAADAMVFRGENKVARRLSFGELYDAVSCLAQALRGLGVEPGDRVAAFVPNLPDTMIAMLATSSIGAVWSSCSPDFGVAGVLDRFGQIEPKVLFSADGYHYNGKPHDSLARLKAIRAQLPSVQKVVVLPYLSAVPQVDAVADAVRLADLTAAYTPGDIEFTRLAFDHPLYILYSSGTTGVPKCIVHGAGGTLLQHLKEHQLHCDIRRNDRVFYFTTCGWMMWNWLASVLASEATVLLYDGAPFYPDGNVLFDFADAEAMTHFGTSAKFIDAVHKAGLEPRRIYRLDALRAMLSTGSPLVAESFDFVYRSIKADMCLASISGGTDIVSCFVLGAPTEPVWRGEIQARGLGMDVVALDEDGDPLPPGVKGELACRHPFPSMPVAFWNDPDGSRYHAAYFDTFPGVWCHGDYVEFTEHGGAIIYGRSDATLNPGGVRIGTAEIYRQAERIDEVVESLVIGQQWDGDVRVVLFVRLRDGLVLDEALSGRIKTRIRQNTTPRHVPARIIQVMDIPRTKSGKIVELAVRKVVHGEPVKNTDALANPAALELFRDLAELLT